MPTPYDFLNNYLSKVSSDSGKADPNTDMDDNDDFYNTVPDQEPQAEDIDYGISTQGEDEQDNFMNDSDQEDQGDGNMLDYLLGNQDPYSQGAADYDESMDEDYDKEGDNEGDEDGENTGGGVEGVPEMTPYTVTAKRKSSNLANKISGNESDGKYSAFNPRGGGGGAVGKYQFRWNIWKDSIMKITGVKSKEQFLKSPASQEKYFAWYAKHYLAPKAEKLQEYNTQGYSMQQLEQMVHFRGETGAKKYLQGKLADKTESYNMPVSQYVGKPSGGTRQTGGSAFYMNPTVRFKMGGIPVASSGGAQFNGLNNPMYDQMLFPMEGANTFRGLDNGEPVYLEDETGKKKVLRGRKHTTKMTGKVYEKRLK